jgi:6-phosphofructokinase 1
MAGLRGNAIVGQSGGPTAVINQSLAGVIGAASEAAGIERLLGARHGVKGILSGSFVDLKTVPRDTIEAVAATPGAGLGSVRKKPTADECLRMFEVMKRHDVRWFFYIGGNDTAETASIVSRVAAEAKYDLRCFHVPKTIDNDLRVTDHCPGFGSAARFVAAAFMGDDCDNRSLPGIKVDVVMGRNAGFLTAAAALARRGEGDGPHLVYVPERPVTREQIRDQVADVYSRLGRCVVAVSEGIVDASSGKLFAELVKGEIAALAKRVDDGGTGIPPSAFECVRLIAGIEIDSHGNFLLSGSGTLGDWLAGYLKRELGKTEKLRVRADTLGYLQRSFAGVVSPTDAAEARECGRKAVEFATRDDRDGTVSMIRVPGAPYAIEYVATELHKVAKDTRVMPDEFIAASGNDVTPAFLDYCRPLAGPLPATGRF